MDRHAYHTFQILEHIEKTPVVTNRRIAGKLDVSVKLAHELLKKLGTKGLLHIRKRNSRRWDYFLTPKGIAEKARLTYEFLDFTMQFYREARRRSAEVLRDLHKAGVEKIAFLGLSEMAEIAFLGVQEHKLRLTEVFDDRRAGEEFMGVPVRPFAQIVQSAAERILVTAFDPALPMGERYLPRGAGQFLGPQKDQQALMSRPARSAIWRTGGLVWVFGRPISAQESEGQSE